MSGHDGSVTSVETDSPADRVWCFQCGNEYDEDVAECVECGVPTTSDRPQVAEEVGDVDDDQLAYELHEWSGQGRSILDGMLTRSLIAHAWQGATLIVKETDEAAVDEAIAQTEVMEMPTLDLTEPTVVYELGDLDDDQHARLLRRMSTAAVSHAFDQKGDMFVYERDEEQVDGFFEGLDVADASERTFGPGVPGVNPVDVIGDLFVASGKLNKKPADSRAVLAFMTTADIVEQMSLPYGFNVEQWSQVVDGANELADGLEGDDRYSSAEVEELSGALQGLLRTMI